MQSAVAAPVLCSVSEAAARVQQLGEAAGRRRVVIGVFGGPGSGKSTVAEQLRKALENNNSSNTCCVVSMDGFHLSNAVLHAKGSRQRKGAHDTFDSGGFGRLLQTLRSSYEEEVYFPVFHRDMEESIAAEGCCAPDVRYVIVEGLYLAYEPWRLQNCFDELWYLDVDDATREQRLIDRRLALGYSLMEAKMWAQGSDKTNGDLVKTTAHRANVLLRLPNETKRE